MEKKEKRLSALYTIKGYAHVQQSTWFPKEYFTTLKMARLNIYYAAYTCLLLHIPK